MNITNFLLLFLLLHYDVIIKSLLHTGNHLLMLPFLHIMQLAHFYMIITHYYFVITKGFIMTNLYTFQSDKVCEFTLGISASA